MVTYMPRCRRTGVSVANGGVMLFHRLYATAAVPVPARRRAHATCPRPDATAGAHHGAVASTTPQQVGHLRGLCFSMEQADLVSPAVFAKRSRGAIALLSCYAAVKPPACMHVCIVAACRFIMEVDVPLKPLTLHFHSDIRTYADCGASNPPRTFCYSMRVLLRDAAPPLVALAFHRFAGPLTGFEACIVLPQA